MVYLLAPHFSTTSGSICFLKSLTQSLKKQRFLELGFWDWKKRLTGGDEQLLFVYPLIPVCDRDWTQGLVYAKQVLGATSSTMVWGSSITGWWLQTCWSSRRKELWRQCKWMYSIGDSLVEQIVSMPRTCRGDGKRKSKEGILVHKSGCLGTKGVICSSEKLEKL